MVENRPWLNVLTHAVLIFGVVIVAFPVSVALIASTHGPFAMGSGRMPLLPGDQLWTIVFPLLSPTTFFLLIVNLNYTMFDTFGVIDATTTGGPNQATNTLVYKVYTDGFIGLNIGSSSAQSVVLMIIVIALTAIQFRYVERRIQY